MMPPSYDSTATGSIIKNKIEKPAQNNGYNDNSVNGKTNHKLRWYKCI
jgi:hypothetical protein